MLLQMRLRMLGALDPHCKRLWRWCCDWGYQVGEWKMWMDRIQCDQVLQSQCVCQFHQWHSGQLVYSAQVLCGHLWLSWCEWLLLSCQDPHPIAKILSDPRSIPYHSPNSVPTILWDSNTTLTIPPNSDQPPRPPMHYHHSPRTPNNLQEPQTTSKNPKQPPRTPITFLSSSVFIILF